jgi:hypothetical protein
MPEPTIEIVEATIPTHHSVVNAVLKGMTSAAILVILVLMVVSLIRRTPGALFPTARR